MSIKLKNMGASGEYRIAVDPDGKVQTAHFMPEAKKRAALKPGGSRHQTAIILDPDSVNDGPEKKRRKKHGKGRRRKPGRATSFVILDPDSVNGPAGDVLPDDACPCCGQPVAPDGDAEAQFFDGRYEGGNSRLALELRVDFEGSGVISGDLFGTDFGRRDYLASFRTAPGKIVQEDDPQPWPAIFEARDGEVVGGEVALEPAAEEDTVLVTLFVDGRIPGLPQRMAISLTADWVSDAMRALGVELEQETGTEAPPAYDFEGREMTLERAFGDAGIEIVDVGGASRIPREAEGWGTAQLHGLMYEWAQSDLTKAAWRQQLLWLGNPARPRLLGVMFDTSALLPRQGTAVFDQEIRQRVTTETERKIIQTAVHEIGHGLNLAHRFEREVGRADSTSFMNYDWRYRGGSRAAEFWDRFNFSFDPDELDFLRHAPRQAIIPGGAAFHSVRYWADGSGGYTPYAPEGELDFVGLEISATDAPPDPLHPHIFDFGQPVFLQVKLTNRSGAPLEMDKRLLDPKGTFLQVTVRRLSGGGGSPGEMRHFHPIMERCFDIEPGALDLIPDGESISDNVQITFGASGFTFAEPGRYEIQAFGSVLVNTQDANPFNDRELIVPSNKLIVHVSHARSADEERDVVDILHNPEVGVYFALGGSRVLDRAQDLLDGLEDRRMQGKKKVTDRVVANIIRCRGIDMGRRYRRFSATGRFRATDGDPAKASQELARLGKEALAAFDPSTAAATVGLMQKHQKRAQAAGKG